jgi:CHAD domain-containing protein
MAMHLRHSEAATSGLRRLLFQRLDASLCLLAGAPLGDDAIHALRRNLKQCRAYLLLLRPALGKSAWRREEAALEAAARTLGTLRDRRVLQDTVESLMAQSGDPLFDAFAQAIRREADDGGRALPERLAGNCRNRLVRSRTRLRATRLARRNWSILGPALRRTYKLARRARAEASATGRDEALHRWRRWAKYLWHQMELIEAADPQVRAMGAQLHALADLLGRYHDLVVLGERVKGSASFVADPEGGARFLALLDAALTAQRGEANALGAPLFAERPREFEKRLRAYWRSWRRTQASSASRR